MTDALRQSWKDIRDIIHARITDRRYAPGDKLPRDEDLAAEFGCARSTVHRAMQHLAELGLLERKRKGGTIVRADPIARATLDIPITRLEVEATGASYGYRLESAQMEPAPPAVLARLGLKGAGPMLHVLALHLANGRPHIFEDRWICTQTVPEILAVDLTRQSANEWLVRHRPHTQYALQVAARAADAALARRLDIEPGTPLLVMHRTTWWDDNPITTVRAVTHPGYALHMAG